MMDQMGRPELEDIEAALDQIAEWLVALFGSRVQHIFLTLEGFYAPGQEYWGIVTSIERANGESRETLPSLPVRALAEGLFQQFFPSASFEKGSNRDVRDVARSRVVRSSDLSAHRRLELLDRFGRPEITR